MVPDRKLSPSIKILLTVLFAVIFSFTCYGVFITAFVDPWLENNQRELCILNFYSEKNNTTAPEIYFIGTSQVKEGIDCYIIEDYLNISKISYAGYNLAVEADSPLRRLTELDPIIKSKPEIVIIGVQIRDIYKNSDIQDSRLMLLSNKITLDNTSAELFDAKELGLLNLDPVTKVTSKRIYIVSFFNYLTLNKIFPNSMADYEYRKNFKNPYRNVENLSINEKIDILNHDETLNDTLFLEYYGSSTNKLALRHIVQELQKNNITVIIISMPSDPLKSTYISNATRNNYFAYLDSLNVPYYDFENRYPSSYFHDLTHMNEQGRTSFSRDIAGIIIRQVGI